MLIVGRTFALDQNVQFPYLLKMYLEETKTKEKKPITQNLLTSVARALNTVRYRLHMYDIATPVTVQMKNNFRLSMMEKIVSFSLKIKEIVKFIFINIEHLYIYRCYINE